MILAATLRAFANERRLQILDWLKDPRAHFREQVDGDLVEDGVCGLLIAEKLGVSQPTVTEHMKLLVDIGAVRARRIKQWTFYKRDEERIRALKAAIAEEVRSAGCIRSAQWKLPVDPLPRLGPRFRQRFGAACHPV